MEVKMETIVEAKKYLRDNLNLGTKCPCCNEFKKIYKRKITKLMIKELIELYKLNMKNRDKYFHITEIQRELKGKYSGEFSKLRYWSLIKEQEKDSDNKKEKSGYWKITGSGIMFIFKKLRIKKYANIYQKKLIELSGEKIKIDECFKNKFDYEEVMKPTRIDEKTINLFKI